MIWLLLALQLNPLGQPEFPPDKPMATAESVRQVIGAPAGSGLAGEALERETTRVASLLRCPVCQGLSVNDSPSAMAVNMKRQVRELLSWGYTEEQVMRYFEASYGEFVRLRPPARGMNWIVWVGPLVALLIGVGLIGYIISRGSAKRAPEEPAHVEADLEQYLARAREITYEGDAPAPPRQAG